jgi:hypothetical protein
LLRIDGFIFPGMTDVGAAADLFVVVETPFGWFMRNAAGAFVRWSTRVADLVPAYANTTLGAQVRVRLYSGAAPGPGLYRFFVGYRRSDGLPTIYSSSAARLTVGP